MRWVVWKEKECRRRRRRKKKWEGGKIGAGKATGALAIICPPRPPRPPVRHVHHVPLTGAHQLPLIHDNESFHCSYERERREEEEEEGSYLVIYIVGRN